MFCIRSGDCFLSPLGGWERDVLRAGFWESRDAACEALCREREFLKMLLERLARRGVLPDADTSLVVRLTEGAEVSEYA